MGRFIFIACKINEALQVLRRIRHLRRERLGLEDRPRRPRSCPSDIFRALDAHRTVLKASAGVVVGRRRHRLERVPWLTTLHRGCCNRGAGDRWTKAVWRRTLLVSSGRPWVGLGCEWLGNSMMLGPSLVWFGNVKKVIRSLLWADRRWFAKFWLLHMCGARLRVRVGPRREGNFCRRGAFSSHVVQRAVCFGGTSRSGSEGSISYSRLSSY